MEPIAQYLKQLRNRSWLLLASSTWNQSTTRSDGANQLKHQKIAKQILASIGQQCLESTNHSVRRCQSNNTRDNCKTDPGFYQPAVPGNSQSLCQMEPINQYMRQLQNRYWLLSASRALNQSITLSDEANRLIHETTAKQILASISTKINCQSVSIVC
jgi:hypothetical protein